MIIIDTIKNHDRIKQIIEDYWNSSNMQGVKVFYKNVIDIRYVCEFNRDYNQIEIKGVRINNIFLSCNQLEKITGLPIVIDKWE